MNHEGESFLNVRKSNKNNMMSLMFVPVVVICLVAGYIFPELLLESRKLEVVNGGAFTEVIKNSELNTFRTPYKGVVTVYNDKNNEKIDYYVSYEAEITAGINFDELKTEINELKKEVVIILPEIIIKEPNVNEATLDYIFVNSKANKPTVSAGAFKKCNEDIKKEIVNNKQIKELAYSNAKNIVEGLAKPLMKQSYKGYKLVIK